MQRWCSNSDCFQDDRWYFHHMSRQADCDSSLQNVFPGTYTIKRRNSTGNAFLCSLLSNCGKFQFLLQGLITTIITERMKSVVQNGVAWWKLNNYFFTTAQSGSLFELLGKEMGKPFCSGNFTNISQVAINVFPHGGLFSRSLICDPTIAAIPRSWYLIMHCSEIWSSIFSVLQHWPRAALHLYNLAYSIELYFDQF